MSLKRKILLFTISILAISLLLSSVVSIQVFRRHYTETLISSSFSVAHNVENLLNELMAQGMPLQSLSNMDRNLTEMVEASGYISYAYVTDVMDQVVFHSHPSKVGDIQIEAIDQHALQAGKPVRQININKAENPFIDVAVPLFDNQQLLGVIRLGFPVSVINDEVMKAIKQLLLNVLITFSMITLIMNVFLRRQVIEPIKQLVIYAESIAKGVPYETVRIRRSDEIGHLSTALTGMSATLKKQIGELRSGGQILEEKVHARTLQLAQANEILEASNSNLKLALQRELELSEALRHSEERFRMLFEQNKAVMLIIDQEDEQIIAANKAAVDYYGYTLEQLLQLKISDINTLSRKDILLEMNLASQEKRSHFFFRHKLASGEVRDVEAYSGPMTWDNRAVLYSIIHDITDRKLAEAKLQRIAHYDPLTGLPNRLLKDDRLRQALNRSRRSETSVAVCYLDLDGFKPINDTHGHDVGDMILIEIAHRIEATVRDGDTVSRIGGDEFVLILCDLSGMEQSKVILERLLGEVSRPIALNDQVIEVCASVGLTLFPQDDSDADILLRHADQAMYVAKANGKNCYHLFDPVEDRQVRAHKEKLQQLEQALADDQFVLYYQPKVNMLTSEVIGMEALIRWQHPQKGLVLPGEFLHYLANTDLEITLGNWVINRALEQQITLREAGLTLPVSVNISAHHLQHGDFVVELQKLLKKQPLQRSGDLEFEILESTSIEDVSNIYHTLISCHEMGIQFSLDDFGTGYSSLAYFHRLPVDTLKIDQTFVQDMLEDPQDLAIVDSVVRLAHAFKHPVIAEGVESLEHGAALLGLGCQLGQGFGIARPMPMDEFIPWKKAWDNDSDWHELKQRIS